MSGALRLRLCASATEIIDTDVIDCGWEPEDGEDEYPTIRAHWKGRALLVTPESAEAVARELNALSNLCDDFVEHPQDLEPGEIRLYRAARKPFHAAAKQCRESRQDLFSCNLSPPRLNCRTWRRTPRRRKPMHVEKKGSAFALTSRYEENALPKAALWRWHGKDCGSGRFGKCRACPAGIPRNVWWTDEPAKVGDLARRHATATGASALTFGDAETAALAQGIAAAKSATLAASRAVDAEINVPAPEGCEYLGYQRAGIAYAMSRPRVLIGDEMGLGKTIQALGLINADPSVKNVLVCCPSSLRLNWQREAQRWLVRKFQFWVVDEASPPPEMVNFVIVGYPRLSGAPGKAVHAALMARNWDLVVVDEAHFCKNPKSQRTIAVLGKAGKKGKGGAPDEPKIDGLNDRARRAAFLTGTPIPNKVIEIQPLLSVLCPQEFGNFFAFAKRYCDARQVQAGRNLVWDFSGSSHLDELQERLRLHVMIRRLKADVLTELPPKRRQLVVFPRTDAVDAEEREWAPHAAEIEALKERAEMARAAEDEESYEAAVAQLAEAEKVAFTEIAAVRHAVALSKVPLAIDHLHELLDGGVGKVIVFAHHKDVINALCAEFDGECVRLTGDTAMADRQAAVDRFQSDPSCRLFFGNLLAAGVGITLTAASTVVFVEGSFVPAEMSQAEDRAHRMGQKSTVLVQSLVIDGSLDQRMMEIVTSKQNTADKALDEVERALVLGGPLAARGKRAGAAGSARPEVYPVPSEEERWAALQALRTLAGMCDGARTLDGAGFSKVDVAFGMRLAKCERLTDGQTWAAKKLARKYRRQLDGQLLQILGCAA